MDINDMDRTYIRLRIELLSNDDDIVINQRVNESVTHKERLNQITLRGRYNSLHGQAVIDDISENKRLYLKLLTWNSCHRIHLAIISMYLYFTQQVKEYQLEVEEKCGQTLSTEQFASFVSIAVHILTDLKTGKLIL